MFLNTIKRNGDSLTRIPVRFFTLLSKIGLMTKVTPVSDVWQCYAQRADVYLLYQVRERRQAVMPASLKENDPGNFYILRKKNWEGGIFA